MNKKNLYYIAAALWGIPGAIITVKGVKSYLTMPVGRLWWLLLITVGVLAGFFFMFTRIVDRYAAWIASQPERTTVWRTFPLRGWILIVCMSCLGVALKFVPGVPAAFTASFYSGLGPMLLYAAARFVTSAKRFV